MDYIEIKGYKSIKDLRLKLAPINILIGANGAGKSNFISFFSFLKNAYDQNLQSYAAKRGIDKILHNGKKGSAFLFGKLSFNNGVNHYSFKLEPSDSNYFIITKEDLGFKGQKDEDVSGLSLNMNRRELQVRDSTMKRARFIEKYIDGLKVYHFHETGVNSPFNSESNLIDYFSLSSNGQNLASVLYNLQQNDRIVYNRIVQTIQSVAPYFLDFDLRPTAEGSELIRLAWRNKSGETLYGASDLSDGTIRFIALVTLFLQPNLPQVIIIDEPELGLHPFAISKLAGLVRSAASRGTQVILATQSVELINCFAPEDIIVVDNNGGDSSFERLDSEKLSVWLDDYAVGDMWRQNILGKAFPNN